MLNKTLTIILLASTIAAAQPKWKPITQQSKPWSRWWWEGNAVNPKDLSYNMEVYKKAGLGGLEVTPIYGVKGYESQFIDFLSPKWVDMFKHTLKEGTRLGMGIDLANASGWPFGGRWVTPEDACKEAEMRIIKKKPENAKNIQVGFLAMNKNGEHGAYAIQEGFTYAVCDSTKQDLIIKGKSYYIDSNQSSH